MSRVSVAPAAITNGSAAGMSSRLASLPLLPAAATTAMPSRHSCSTAHARTSLRVAAAVLDAEREVDDADVEPVRVAVAVDPLERGEHAGEAGLAVGAGDLDADQARARRHAGEAGERVAAGDQAGDVRAVAEGVERGEPPVAALVREVGAVDHAAGLGEPADRDHAGVDQRDVDAVAVSGARLDAGAPGDPLHRGGGGSVARVLRACRAGSANAMAARPSAAVRRSFGLPRPSQRIP